MVAAGRRTRVVAPGARCWPFNGTKLRPLFSIIRIRRSLHSGSHEAGLSLSLCTPNPLCFLGFVGLIGVEQTVGILCIIAGSCVWLQVVVFVFYSRPPTSGVPVARHEGKISCTRVVLCLVLFLLHVRARLQLLALVSCTPCCS